MKKEAIDQTNRRESVISRDQRKKMTGHRGICLWFTGLSASGKSTIAWETKKILYDRGLRTYILDGDHIRQGLNRDLGFSPEDRSENIRRVGEVAKLFVDAGIIVITAFISPYRHDRQRARNLFGKQEFIEIYLEADLDTCEKRDPKGLYKRARAGEIPDFTGISAPYEVPLNPELIVNTTKKCNIRENAQSVVTYLKVNKYL
jgi:adenylylsulfate kinase